MYFLQLSFLEILIFVLVSSNSENISTTSNINRQNLFPVLWDAIIENLTLRNNSHKEERLIKDETISEDYAVLPGHNFSKNEYKLAQELFNPTKMQLDSEKYGNKPSVILEERNANERGINYDPIKEETIQINEFRTENEITQSDEQIDSSLEHFKIKFHSKRSVDFEKSDMIENATDVDYFTISSDQTSEKGVYKMESGDSEVLKGREEQDSLFVAEESETAIKDGETDITAASDTTFDGLIDNYSPESELILENKNSDVLSGTEVLEATMLRVSTSDLSFEEDTILNGILSTLESFDDASVDNTESQTADNADNLLTEEEEGHEIQTQESALENTSDYNIFDEMSIDQSTLSEAEWSKINESDYDENKSDNGDQINYRKETKRTTTDKNIQDSDASSDPMAENTNDELQRNETLPVEAGNDDGTENADPQLENVKKTVRTANEHISTPPRLQFDNMSNFDLHEIIEVIKTDRNVQASILNVLILYIPVLICDILLWVVIVKLVRHISRQILFNRASNKTKEVQSDLKPGTLPSDTTAALSTSKLSNESLIRFRSYKCGRLGEESDGDYQECNAEFIRVLTEEKIWYPPN